MGAIVSQVKCKNCSGKYEMREGKTGMFGGCQNYPDCKSTVSIAEAVELLKIIY